MEDIQEPEHINNQPIGILTKFAVFTFKSFPLS